MPEDVKQGASSSPARWVDVNARFAFGGSERGQRVLPEQFIAEATIVTGSAVMSPADYLSGAPFGCGTRE